MGIFMLCMGGYLAGGSVSKVFNSKKYEKIEPYIENQDECDNNDENYDYDDEVPKPRHRKKKHPSRNNSSDDYYDNYADNGEYDNSNA